MPELMKSASIPSDTLSEILEIASLSPSSHNTQPWKVHAEGSNSVVVGYSPERQLRVGDPNKRELFISLGCFIESAYLAASDRGYTTTYTYLGTDHNKVARLEFTKRVGENIQETKWEPLIKHRRSDRRLYDEKKISPQDMADFDALSVGVARLVLVDQSTNIEFLATMTREATLEIMSTQAFRDELANWVRNNWTKKPDGMPGYTQGMPGPISLLAKFVIRKNKQVAIDQAKKDGKRVAHSAAVGLICVPKESPAPWIDAGRLHQRVCLEALHRKIKTSAVSAAVISPSTSRKILDKFELSEEPVTLIRFGYKGKTPKAAPRLSVEDFSY